MSEVKEWTRSYVPKKRRFFVKKNMWLGCQREEEDHQENPPTDGGIMYVATYKGTLVGVAVTGRDEGICW